MTRVHDDMRARLRRLYDAAVDAALPAHCLPPHLPEPPKPDAGRLVIFAIGKAAASMTAAAEDHYDRHFPGTHIEGMALTRYGHGRPTRHVDVVEASPPVPDAMGAAASKRLMRMAGWLEAARSCAGAAVGRRLGADGAADPGLGVLRPPSQSPSWRAPSSWRSAISS